PVVCVNCARPACVEVCPTGAAHIDRSVPVVRIDEEECTGCRDCIKACPFGAADFNDQKEVAFMCDLCDGEPACVDNCIYGALSFEPVQTVAQRKRRATAESFALGEHIV
ncbi:MAG: 4Fe-4S dicluster domain-containing protein, partial [Anaerolineae bacterium]